ncbi:hypothetical protein COW38_04685 [Candidatus Collierbacteria bacterium CG17_big_fil_post_rev_8_21_14_2_50_45_7]|uniref:Uncharacterized protein n=1 Tax=Candidatus Collierbacteria bacterium CG17_big_fil_post_rev_8_21_14_2_50_45_7 TaxID=1974536 RepID=A0A2M7FKU3_9BACT|nr:MAG: hypothetical protein COW38_04685 [Candidatus Collierbacteria bacterium CG17_big_fil_post_rev_8_21_14_2_50_45_7]
MVVITEAIWFGVRELVKFLVLVMEAILKVRVIQLLFLAIRMALYHVVPVEDFVLSQLIRLVTRWE